MTDPAGESDSPCIRSCCLDEVDVCIGCGRHVQEILRWSQAGPEERQAILGRAAARRDARPAFWFRLENP